jgi:2'-5' RNA ligase
MGLRTFVAIEVPEDISSSITHAIAPLRSLLADSVKWVKPDNIHITLKFLGDTPKERIVEIESALARATGGIGPMNVTVKGLGAFPDQRKPNVLWVGLECPPVITELKEHMEIELSRLGFEFDNKPFSPHLTVGRVRRGARVPRRRLAAGMELLKGITFGTMEIREMALMKSDLRAGGPVYTKLFSAAL